MSRRTHEPLSVEQLREVYDQRLSIQQIRDRYGASRYQAFKIRHCLGMSAKQVVKGIRRGCLLHLIDRTPDELEIEHVDQDTVILGSPGSDMSRVQDLVIGAGLDPAEWYVDRVTVNEWQTTARDVDGALVKSNNYQTKATLRRIPAPLLNPPKPAKVYAFPSRGGRIGGRSRNMVIPDLQVGFEFSDDRTALVPFHDFGAMLAAVEWARENQPDAISLLGDNLDLPGFSRWRQNPTHGGTASAAFAVYHWFLESLRAACPFARIVWIAGNHDIRAKTKAMTEIPALYELVHPVTGLKLLSLRHMLGLDDLGIEVIEEYQDGYFWHGVWLTHGTKHGSKPGAVLAKMLDGRATSIVQGHDHKAAIADSMIQTPEGWREIFAMCPGTLSRTDFHSPLPRARKATNWSQSIGEIVHDGSNGLTFGRLMPIRRGRLYDGGRVYEVDADKVASKLAQDLGWPQLAKGQALATRQIRDSLAA